MALAVPIARGWNRQLDRKLNALFYGRSLDADALSRWLHDRSVCRYVAIADTELDPAGELEADAARPTPVVPPRGPRRRRLDGVRGGCTHRSPLPADGDA